MTSIPKFLPLTGIYDSKITGVSGIINENGQFIFGSRNITPGKNVLILKPGYWEVKESYDQFVVTLICQYGERDADFQKVDTVFVNLNCLSTGSKIL